MTNAWKYLKELLKIIKVKTEAHKKADKRDVSSKTSSSVDLEGAIETAPLKVQGHNPRIRYIEEGVLSRSPAAR